MPLVKIDCQTKQFTLDQIVKGSYLYDTDNDCFVQNVNIVGGTPGGGGGSGDFELHCVVDQDGTKFLMRTYLDENENYTTDYIDSNGNVATPNGPVTFCENVPIVEIKHRILCDYHEVDVNGVPTASTGIFKNQKYIHKYIESNDGTETTIGAFAMDGSTNYSVIGTSKVCPIELCCESWCEIVLVPDRRLVMKSPNDTTFLSDSGEQFQQGTYAPEFEIVTFEIDGVDQINGATNTFTLSTANYNPVQCIPGTYNCTPVPPETTEDTYTNFADLLQSLLDDQFTVLGAYGENQNGFQSAFALDITSSRDLNLVWKRKNAFTGVTEWTYSMTYDSGSDTAQFLFAPGDTTPFDPFMYSYMMNI